jgi:hypothetical protein
MTEQAKTDYVALVLHADIPSATMKLILLAIAALANENGKCRPSISRLAVLTGFDRRTITRNLKELEKDYWLYIERIGTPQRRETNFYELNVFKLQTDQIALEVRGIRPLVEAQDPYPRGTVTPNTKPITAPRPTAAPQAQAGGSGTGSNSKKENPFIEQSANTKVARSASTSETEPNPIECEPFAHLDQPEPEQKADEEDGGFDFWSDDEPEEERKEQEQEPEPHALSSIFL